MSKEGGSTLSGAPSALQSNISDLPFTQLESFHKESVGPDRRGLSPYNESSRQDLIVAVCAVVVISGAGSIYIIYWI